jgi:hypothetical protein
VSSRTVRATQRNPVSKNQKPNQTNKTQTNKQKKKKMKGRKKKKEGRKERNLFFFLYKEKMSHHRRPKLRMTLKP